nr:hypothetical protein CFP56_78599 [Quercus suber]
MVGAWVWAIRRSQKARFHLDGQLARPSVLELSATPAARPNDRRRRSPSSEPDLHRSRHAPCHPHERRPRRKPYPPRVHDEQEKEKNFVRLSRVGRSKTASDRLRRAPGPDPGRLRKDDCTGLGSRERRRMQPGSDRRSSPIGGLEPWPLDTRHTTAFGRHVAPALSS